MKFIQYQLISSIAYITLNRPDKRNALNFQVVAELKEALAAAELDKNAKVIVLKAEGKTFCAGADLEYLQQLQKNTYEENLADSSHLKDLFLQIYTLKKLVIAQIQGDAIAGGCGLATVCDISFSVAEAKFGYTEVKIGFIPAIVSFFLLRKIGEAKAKDLLLSGKLISAQEAHAYGLVNFIVEENTLEETVKTYAENICKSNSSQSMALTKQMIAEIQHKNVHEALNYAAEMNAKARESDDCKKGIAAFLNKEKIVW